MPRTYIRKKIKSYTTQDLAQAIEKVKNGECTLYRAAKEFKIPTTTLYEHIQASKENTRPNAGRPTAIPIEEEKKLAETIITRGAEVITAAMGKRILEEIENNKDMKVTTKSSKNYKKDLLKSNKRNNSTMKICTLQNQEEQPSSSGIKYKNKRKRLRQLSLDSITSVSDIISIHNDPDIIDYTDLEETTEEHYKISDAVLVRYLIRKKWKYYIGFIEEIIKHEQTYYFINFLKTARPKQQLTFIITKRKDIDKVPESLIVKKVDIQRKHKNEKEYYLCNDGDRIYFD